MEKIKNGEYPSIVLMPEEAWDNIRRLAETVDDDRKVYGFRVNLYNPSQVRLEDVPDMDVEDIFISEKWLSWANESKWKFHEDFSVEYPGVVRIHVEREPESVEAEAEEETGVEERYSLLADEESLAMDMDMAKYELLQEAESVIGGVAQSVQPSIESVLEDVKSVGREIEQEVISSLLLVIHTGGLEPGLSDKWFDFLLQVSDLIETRAFAPPAGEVSDALWTLRDELRSLVVDSMKNDKLYGGAEERSLGDVVPEMDELADHVVDELLSSKEFVEVVQAGVAGLRYGLFARGTDLYKSYKHAIRLNGYVLSSVLSQAAPLLKGYSVDTEALRKLREQIASSARADVASLAEKLGRAKTVPLKREEHRRDEEELVEA